MASTLLDKLLDRHHFEGYEKRTYTDEYGVASSEYVYVRDYYYLSGGEKKHLIRKVLFSVFFIFSLAAQAAGGIQRSNVNYALYVNIFQALALISALPLAAYLYHYVSAPFKMELHHYIRCHRRLISLTRITGLLLLAVIPAMMIRIILSPAAFSWSDVFCIAMYLIAAVFIFLIFLAEHKAAYIIQPSEYK